MGDFFDSLAKVIQIPLFVSLSLLIILNILNDCTSVGYVFCSLLTFNVTNRDRISPGESGLLKHYIPK